MQWVWSDYTLKVPDWEWSYKYDYAPNLTSIIEACHLKTWRSRETAEAI